MRACELVIVTVLVLAGCSGSSTSTPGAPVPARRQESAPAGIQGTAPPRASTTPERPGPEPATSTEQVGPVTAAEESRPAAKPRYHIIAQDLASTGKASFDVRIPAAVEQAEIRDMATEIRRTRAESRNPVFVSFYLPGQQVGAGAYAAVQFRPQMNVNMLGATPSEQTRMDVAAPTEDLLGRWVDSSPIMGGVITITSDLRLEKPFKDGSVMKRKLRETKTGRGRRFDPVPASGHGDHWLLLPSGELEIRDREGLIATARKKR